MIKSLFISSWSNYFPTIEEPTSSSNYYSYSKYTNQVTCAEGNVYVKLCIFEGITSYDIGGSIKINNSDIFMVESSEFQGCKTTGVHGGALLYENTKGRFVAEKVCAFDCSGTDREYSYGQFFYINSKCSDQTSIDIQFSSFFKVIGNDKQEASLYLEGDKIITKYNNISKNSINNGPAMYCYTQSTFNAFYSSFTENTGTYTSSKLIFVGNGKYEFFNCNFIKNKLEYCLLEQTNSIIHITESSFLENNSPSLLKGTIHVIRCAFDRELKDRNIKYDEKTDKFFTNQLHLFYVDGCKINIQRPSRRKNINYRKKEIATLILIWVAHNN